MSNPLDKTELRRDAQIPDLSSDAQDLLDAAHEVNLDFDGENITLIIALLRARATRMDTHRAQVLSAPENADSVASSMRAIFMNGYAYAAMELRDLATELEAHS